MPFVFKRLALFLSITAVLAADKEGGGFRAAPAASYEHKQTNAPITIAVDAYNTPEKEKTAFGKLDLYSYGVLPVLLVIQNDGDKAYRLDNLRLEYIGPDGNHVEATPAKDVRYLNGPNRPVFVPGPPKLPPITRGKKNPLNAWEVEGRAFVAQMLAPGQSASGFVYFQTGLQHGATVYVSGVSEAASGKELLYFEIPLQ
jgi:hypothetical protein